MCFHAGPDVRFLAVIPVALLMCPRQGADIPAALRACGHLRLQCCIGSSLQNCSLQMRGWTRIPQGAIITCWNNVASDRRFFPVCSLFQISQSCQEGLFPSNSDPFLHSETSPEVSARCRWPVPAPEPGQHRQLVGGPSLPSALAREACHCQDSQRCLAPSPSARFLFPPLSPRYITQIPLLHGPPFSMVPISE